MFAGVAELADAQASGACGSNVVWVQVPSPAVFFTGRLNSEVFRYFIAFFEVISFFNIFKTPGIITEYVF